MEEITERQCYRLITKPAKLIDKTTTQELSVLVALILVATSRLLVI